MATAESLNTFRTIAAKNNAPAAIDTTAELQHAGDLARELLAVGYIREPSINRFKGLVRSIEAGENLASVVEAMTEMRASGELREEGNDRYQAILHCISNAAYGQGVEDARASLAAKAGQADKPAPARRPAAKRPAKKAKAKG